MNTQLRISSIAVLVALAACGTKSADTDFLASDIQRQMNPSPGAGDVDTLVDGNSAYAFDSYRRLGEEAGDDDVFFSPFSHSIALAMTWGGARGDTESQMAEALHFDLDQASLHPAFNYLDLELADREDDAYEMGIPFELHVANSTWGLPGYPFVEDYLDLLAENYGAGLHLCDFAADPEACRVAINDWVEGETAGLIEDLIPEGNITTLTRMVLANAIYFKAAWNSPFEVEQTEDGTFHLADGGTVTVPMMYQQAAFPYAEGADWQAVELPYDGEVFSMVIVVPDDLSAFESALDPQALQDVLDAMDLYSVQLTLPRFECESAFLLREPLQDLGMVDAFDPSAADLTGIADTGELYISQVIHKAFITVDEAGTEAAAATAVVVDGWGAPEEVALTIDRPFFYVIRDIPSGTILFMGRVNDPS